MYHSGLLKRQAILLKALSEVAALRNQLSPAKPTPSTQVAAPHTQLYSATEHLGGYAAMLMDGSLAGTPAAAAAFLRQLAGGLRGRAEEDVGALRELKAWRARKEGRGSSEGLEGWDVDRLLALAASERQGRGRGTQWEDYADYFSLTSLLQV